ncbi:hypothetical protein ACIQNG_22465 [Streptomyces sp. NPDC091377]|uniref:hypothetical protein n=1 Tax=Streptomyces sp. NPDC091377 TaxID=3365995 RepID=UPI0037F1AF7C
MPLTSEADRALTQATVTAFTWSTAFAATALLIALFGLGRPSPRRGQVGVPHPTEE